MNINVARKRLSQVFRIDSIDSTESDFLATHVPFRKIVVNTKSGEEFEESKKSEEELFKDIFDLEKSNEHQFIIVEGSSGAGKSHFIRWLDAKLSVTNEVKKDNVVILIKRSDNTLKGTIRQLLDNDEVKGISNKEAYERLAKANKAISENKFKSTIYHSFIVEIENDTSEVFQGVKRKKLLALLNNSLFQEKMMSAGGPIERLYNRITGSVSNVESDSEDEFTSEDLTLDVDFVNKLDDADRKARDFANSLMEGGEEEFVERVRDYLNSFVDTVVHTSAGIEAGDFQQIFKEIRQELKRKGKNLILLVEDVTSFTGINRDLLNALITGHTGSNAADNLCRLISVLGTTSEYYRKFRENYRARVTKQIMIHDGAIGENSQDLIQFVAKYLNAISFESEVFEKWAKELAYDENMPVYEDKEHEHWDSYVLESKKRISLFPFTKNSIVNLYNSMANKKTPRYILRDIVEPALNEIINTPESFPKFCIGWRYSRNDNVENRINNIVSSLSIPDESKPDYRKRLIAFLAHWSDKTIDVTNDGKIAGLNSKIFMELGFGDFVSKLSSTSTVKSAPKPKQETEEVSIPLQTSDIQPSVINISSTVPKSFEPVQTTVPVTVNVKTEVPKINPKNEKEYNEFRENVVAWHHDGGKLIRFVPIRDAIGKFVYDTINWQQEGVPLDSKKWFMDSIGGRIVGIERQDQAIDKCIVILPDSEETYQVLLCFGKWLFIGEKSWNFPDAASSIYIVTSWLERNKEKFVNAVKNAEKKSLPAYIKAAMISQIYKRILNGSIGNIKLNQIGSEIFLDSECVKNTAPSFVMGHSQSWYDLHKLVYSESKSVDAYTASVRYFNLIQGTTINTDNFVLNYELYQNAVKEMRKSNFDVSEIELNDLESVVKDKREIFEYSSKISSKIHQVVEEETHNARITAIEILKFFDSLELDDEIESRDIRTILNDILSFYNKAVSAGINIGAVSKDIIDNFKDNASDIADAMNIIQKDYSCESDIETLLAFSSNPIGRVLPFFNFINKANQDVDKAYEMMKNEKDNLTRKGSWSESTDPRFNEKRDEFNSLLSAFEGV